MAIEVIKLGNGEWPGHRSNIESYRVREDSTPLNLADTSGSTGSVEITVPDNRATTGTLLLNDAIELVDSGQGRVPATISALSGNGFTINASGMSRLNLMVATVTAQPYTGTLSGMFTYYLGLVGITSAYVVDSSISSTPVIAQGWRDELWLKMKQLCAKYNVEISLVSSNIVLRPIRSRIAELAKISELSWGISNNELSRRVSVVYYNSTSGVNRLVYPATIYSDQQIIQGSAGEIRSYSFPISSTLTSINQPAPTPAVGRFYSGPLSVYSVIDQSEVDVTSWWAANGGSVRVTQRADFSGIIDVQVYAPRSGTTGPYSIAGIDANGKYSSLKVTGTGVFINPQTITGATGADPTRTGRDIGTTVDNINVNTLSDAYEALAKASAAFAGPDQTVNMSATVINRTGDSGQIQYATFNDFNTNNAGRTFNQFNTAFSGQTFEQVNTYYTNLVADSFANQAFGNSAGARVRYKDAQYRIRNATTTPLGVEFDAEIDTIFTDFNTVNNGLTFSQFNTRWANKTFDDFATIPLWGGL